MTFDDSDIIAEMVTAAFDEVRSELPACTAIAQRFAPVRSGLLQASTRTYLGRRSNSDVIVVVVEADPPRQTGPYNSFKKSFGQVDYGNFTNARGSSAGWVDDAANAVANKLDN